MIPTWTPPKPEINVSTSGGAGIVDGPRLNRHVHTINYLTREAQPAIKYNFSISDWAWQHPEADSGSRKPTVDFITIGIWGEMKVVMEVVVDNEVDKEVDEDPSRSRQWVPGSRLLTLLRSESGHKAWNPAANF